MDTTQQQQQNQQEPREGAKFSFGSIFRDLGSSAKGAVRSEIDLALAEMQNNIKQIIVNAAAAAFFGMLAALSVVPFMAFLVIGLGEILEGRYWLSALIVAVVFAALFGYLARRAHDKVLNPQFGLPRTKAKMSAYRNAMQEQMDQLNEKVRRAI